MWIHNYCYLLQLQIKKGGKNEDHEREAKEEKEKREKAIGLLKYLGESAVEGQSKFSVLRWIKLIMYRTCMYVCCVMFKAVKPWYFNAPRRKEEFKKAKTEK